MLLPFRCRQTSHRHCGSCFLDWRGIKPGAFIPVRNNQTIWGSRMLASRYEAEVSILHGGSLASNSGEGCGCGAFSSRTVE